MCMRVTCMRTCVLICRWAKTLTGYSVIFSPNFVWLCVALADYALFPYDLDAAREVLTLNS